MTPTKATVARSGAWAAATVMGSELIFLVVFVAVSRILGPHDIGIVTLAGVFVELLSLVALLGIPQAVVQAAALSPDKADTAFWLVQVTAVLCAVIAYFSAAPIALWFGVPEIEGVLKVLAILPPITSIGAIHEARLTREFRFRALTFRVLTANALSGAIALLMALNGFGIWSLVVQRLVLSGGFSLWSWVACRWMPGIRVSADAARSLIHFGKSVLVADLAWPLNLRLYDIILGHALGPSAVGWFRLAMRCFEFLVKGLSLPLIRVSLPALSRLTHLPAVFRETLCRQIKLAFMAALPAFSGAALLADDLLVTVFGDRWQLSVTVFQVLCVAGPLMVLERLAWTALTAIGKPAWMARTHLWMLTGTAAIAWYCAGYGLVAVAWIFVLRGLILIPIISYLLRQVQALEFGAWLGQMGRVSLASFLVTGMAAVVQAPVISGLGLLLGLPVIVLGSVLVYALLLKVIAPVQFREVVEVLALIRHGRLAHT